MDITDILALDACAEEWVPPTLEHYQPLADVLQNNSQPKVARPVEPPLEELTEFLKTVPTAELSTQQFAILDTLDISHLLGKQGAYWVRKTVRTTTYAPATTNRSVQSAVNSLQQATQKMPSFVTAAEALGFDVNAEELDDCLFASALKTVAKEHQPLSQDCIVIG